MNEAARETLAAAIGWEQAHVAFDTAVADVPPDFRGRRPGGYPHSLWELVEHVRLAQADLVAFMAGPAYVAPDWPAGYWPDDPEPPTADAWDESVAAVRADREILRAVATNEALDLTSEIPWGTGQTYLRTLLLAVDHSAYHVGQIVALRRALGAWT